jgi:hypothetical protein
MGRLGAFITTSKQGYFLTDGSLGYKVLVEPALALVRVAERARIPAAPDMDEFS